jgi:hypothetical protein
MLLIDMGKSFDSHDLHTNLMLLCISSVPEAFSAHQEW